jgi:hypothetical protein
VFFRTKGCSEIKTNRYLQITITQGHGKGLHMTKYPLRVPQGILRATNGVGASLRKHYGTCVNPLTLLKKSTMTECY